MLHGEKAKKQLKHGQLLMGNCLCQAQSWEDMTKHYLDGDETKSRVQEVRSRFEEQMVSTPPSGLCETPSPLAKAAWLINREGVLPTWLHLVSTTLTGCSFQTNTC